MSEFPNSPVPGLAKWPMELETAALAGAAAETALNSAQAESLELTSVWQLASPSDASEAMTGQAETFVYRRVEHPNARSLASKLALLHGASRAVLTAQGMSAIAALAMAHLRPGAQVWMGDELYGETSHLLGHSLARWQVAVHTFDPCSNDQLAQLSAAKQVDLVFIETLTNPRLRTPDIAKVASATHQAGGKLVVDNTFATHLLCRPLALGADFVVESLGKQVNGHSDGMLGLVAASDEQLMAPIAAAVKTFGWTSSPLDCYLTQRGLLSLAVRMERACENAQALAHSLLQLPGIERVDYPGITNHASHSVGRQQFSGGYGWMVCFQVAACKQRVEQLFDALRPEIKFVPSLGDVNTTLSHPLLTSHRNTAPETLSRLGIDYGTIRVSCGIEPTAWLLNRFRVALEKVSREYA